MGCCKDGSQSDYLGYCADGTYDLCAGDVTPGGGPSGGGSISPPVSGGNGVGLFGELTGFLGGLTSDITSGYKALSTRPATNVQTLPGAGYLVNGQFVASPNVGGGSLAGLFSGNSLIFLIIAAVAFYFLRKKA
jgi:hypothetical protein